MARSIIQFFRTRFIVVFCSVISSSIIHSVSISASAAIVFDQGLYTDQGSNLCYNEVFRDFTIKIFQNLDTLVKCEAKCDAYARCISIEYNSNSDECRLFDFFIEESVNSRANCGNKRVFHRQSCPWRSTSLRSHLDFGASNAPGSLIDLTDALDASVKQFQPAEGKQQSKSCQIASNNIIASYENNAAQGNDVTVYWCQEKCALDANCDHFEVTVNVNCILGQGNPDPVGVASSDSYCIRRTRSPVDAQTFANACQALVQPSVVGVGDANPNPDCGRLYVYGVSTCACVIPEVTYQETTQPSSPSANGYTRNVNTCSTALTPPPTPLQTILPTFTPTKLPTPVPTKLPTKLPTEVPGGVPTDEPPPPPTRKPVTRAPNPPWTRAPTPRSRIFPNTLEPTVKVGTDDNDDSQAVITTMAVIIGGILFTFFIGFLFAQRAENRKRKVDDLFSAANPRHNIHKTKGKVFINRDDEDPETLLDRYSFRGARLPSLKEDAVLRLQEEFDVEEAEKKKAEKRSSARVLSARFEAMRSKMEEVVRPQLEKVMNKTRPLSGRFDQFKKKSRFSSDNLYAVFDEQEEEQAGQKTEKLKIFPRRKSTKKKVEGSSGDEEGDSGIGLPFQVTKDVSVKPDQVEEEADGAEEIEVKVEPQEEVKVAVDAPSIKMLTLGKSPDVIAEFGRIPLGPSVNLKSTPKTLSRKIRNSAPSRGGGVQILQAKQSKPKPLSSSLIPSSKHVPVMMKKQQHKSSKSTGSARSRKRSTSSSKSKKSEQGKHDQGKRNSTSRRRKSSTASERKQSITSTTSSSSSTASGGKSHSRSNSQATSTTQNNKHDRNPSTTSKISSKSASSSSSTSKKDVVEKVLKAPDSTLNNQNSPVVIGIHGVKDIDKSSNKAYKFTDKDRDEIAAFLLEKDKTFTKVAVGVKDATEMDSASTDQMQDARDKADDLIRKYTVTNMARAIKVKYGSVPLAITTAIEVEELEKSAKKLHASHQQQQKAKIEERNTLIEKLV